MLRAPSGQFFHVDSYGSNWTGGPMMGCLIVGCFNLILIKNKVINNSGHILGSLCKCGYEHYEICEGIIYSTPMFWHSECMTHDRLQNELKGSHKSAIIVDTSSIFLSLFDTLTARVCFNMAWLVYLKFTLECCLLRQSHTHPRVYLTLELEWSSCHRHLRWGQIFYWGLWWLCFTNYIYRNRAHFLSALTWSHLVTPQVRAVTSYAGVGQDWISVAVAFTVIKKKSTYTQTHTVKNSS